MGISQGKNCNQLKGGGFMTEGLFVLTVIFVAYVIYVAVNDHKGISKSVAPKAKQETPKETIIQPIVDATVKKVKPTANAPKPAAKSAEKPKTKIQATPPAKKGLKDPVTGEVTTAYANYRFTKRWIKDALVAEGLVEKVYKNAELDPAIEDTIKAALLKLEKISKYKP
jgi:hypothetical protein